MACRFETSPSLRAPRDAAAARDQSAPALRFEMAAPPPLMALPFASLSAAAGGSAAARRAGAPLFTLARAAPPAPEPERLRVIRVKGDGKCLFRSLALGMARNQGRVLGGAAEEQEADLLRLAVAEALCRSPQRRAAFPEAVMALELEDTLAAYCRRIVQPGFWGGEPEMLVLSEMLRLPIHVYLAAAGGAGGGAPFSPIQRYGERYESAGRDWKRRRPVRLLFSGGNHFDLLVA